MLQRPYTDILRILAALGVEFEVQGLGLKVSSFCKKLLDDLIGVTPF